MLKCKVHSKDAAFFCESDKIWLCNTCLPNHFDHSLKLMTSTNEEINSRLDEINLFLL